ncbi:monocarboxylate permease [Agrocybe pediades]|nr:monocarboxylate permease [Agrocybe pediades]
MSRHDSTTKSHSVSSKVDSRTGDNEYLEKKEDGAAVVDVKDEEESTAAAPTFPDGGLRAWAVIAAGYINSFGVYQDFYVREYLTNFTPSDIGWIGGTQICLNFSVGALTGRYFDRGYCLIVFCIVFMLSLSHKNAYYQVFLTNGVGLGIASGMSYTLTFAIIGHYFNRKRSLAVGIVASGAAIGAIIHPIMLNRLINSHLGFHTAVRISAAMNVSFLAIACFFMVPRLPPRQDKFPILQWVREPEYLFLLIGSVFVFIGLFFAAFYLQLDAILHGVDKNLAFYSLSILNAASFFGRTIPTALAPRLGVFNIGSFFTTGTGVIVFFMIFMKDLAGTIVFAIFFGVFSGACVSTTTAMLANTAKNPNEVGTRLGVYFGIGGIFGLFASPMLGALLTKHYHWTRTIVFAAVNMVLCGICFFIARCFMAKAKGTHRV